MLKSIARHATEATVDHYSLVGMDEKMEVLTAVAELIGVPTVSRPRSDDSPKLWRSHPDLNWGMVVLQTTALPLGYGSKGSGYVPKVRPVINASAHVHHERSTRNPSARHGQAIGQSPVIAARHLYTGATCGSGTEIA